jgi:hypothetical protein
MTTKLSGRALGVLRKQCKVHDVTIRTHTTSRGTAGGTIRVASTVKTATCRIQPLTARESNELLQHGMRVTHRAYFADDPAVDEKHWLLFGMRSLWVVGVRNLDELGQLWEVDCEERSDGDS